MYNSHIVKRQREHMNKDELQMLVLTYWCDGEVNVEACSHDVDKLKKLVNDQFGEDLDWVEEYGFYSVQLCVDGLDCQYMIDPVLLIE